LFPLVVLAVVRVQIQGQTTARATTKAKYGDPSLRSRMTTKNKVQQRSNYNSEATTTAKQLQQQLVL
jgi:hypothetical protein